MNMVAKLFSVEWIKIRKRTIFWVALVGFATMLTIGFGAQQYMHHRQAKNDAFMLPGDWDSVISIGHSIGMLMILIAVALLTASEATWRTQRQNVIDGLSRGQYFVGKLLVVLLVAVALWITMIVVPVIIAPFGGAGSLKMPIFSALSARMLPNALFYFVAMGSAAFLFGMIASSSGAALGLMFAFVIIEPVIGGVMTGQGGMFARMARYLPLDTFGSLVARASYDPQAMARMTAVAKEFGRPAPVPLTTGMVLSAVYILVFIGIAWMAFRTRDL